MDSERIPEHEGRDWQLATPIRILESQVDLRLKQKTGQINGGLGTLPLQLTTIWGDLGGKGRYNLPRKKTSKSWPSASPSFWRVCALPPRCHGTPPRVRSSGEQSCARFKWAVGLNGSR